MKFNIIERIKTGDILPAQGNFITLTIAEDLRNKIKLTQKEIKDWEVKVEGTAIQWDVQKTKEIDLELTDSELKLISDELKKLDEKGTLDKGTMELYKKFCK